MLITNIFADSCRSLVEFVRTIFFFLLFFRTILTASSFQNHTFSKERLLHNYGVDCKSNLFDPIDHAKPQNHIYHFVV